MNKAYKSDEALCKWLRDNSSGDYRLAGYAAERIETLQSHLDSVNKVADGFEQQIDALKADITVIGDKWLDETAARIKVEEERDALKAHIQAIENLSVWSWMSAALNDSKVCDEMKDDINRAFYVIGNPEQSLAEHDREVHDAGYNKAIEDARRVMLDDYVMVENGAIDKAIRQLKKGE